MKAPVHVTIGDDPAWTFRAAGVDEEPWNGWACPWFTEAEGRKIAAVSRTAWGRDPEQTREYIAAADGACPEHRFWMLAPGEDQAPYPVEAQNLDGVWLYAIGAANWTWETRRSP